VTPTTATSTRDLQRQVRAWRNSRAGTTLHEKLSDAYIWVFGVVLIGAMAIGAMMQTRDDVVAACSSSTCHDARASLTWATATAALALAAAAARAVGPVMVTSATGTWFLSTPLERTPLLRVRLLTACLLGAMMCGAAVAAAGLLAGHSPRSIAVLGSMASAGGVAVVAAAAIFQEQGRTMRSVAPTLAVLACAQLLATAAGHPLAPAVDRLRGPLGAGIAAASIVAASALLVQATRELRALRRAQLVPGGGLVSSLSGAVASVDPTLAYDVLVARKWRAVATVRSVRGGPRGPWALVWRDVVRLRRSAGALAAMVASLLAPYVAVSLDLDGAVVPASAAAATASGVWICSALRATARSSALVRCFPTSLARVRGATLVVPGAVLVLWSMAAAPAVGRAIGAPGVGVAILVSLATAAAALGAIVRWSLAGPPDYARPLISTPAGAVPSGLVLSSVRGLDVLALLLLPLLISPGVIGALVTLGMAALVLGLTLRRP
jgi:hypothetical protein